MLVFLVACKDDGGTLPYFEPVAVGVRLEGMLGEDGALVSAAYKGTPVPPTLALEFVSEAYFVATTAEGLAANSCLAFAPFEMQPVTPSVPTYDSSPLFVSYETTALSITEHSCASRVDPSSGARTLSSCCPSSRAPT